MMDQQEIMIPGFCVCSFLLGVCAHYNLVYDIILLSSQRLFGVNIPCHSLSPKPLFERLYGFLVIHMVFIYQFYQLLVSLWVCRSLWEPIHTKTCLVRCKPMQNFFKWFKQKPIIDFQEIRILSVVFRNFDNGSCKETAVIMLALICEISMKCTKKNKGENLETVDIIHKLC